MVRTAYVDLSSRRSLTPTSRRDAGSDGRDADCCFRCPGIGSENRTLGAALTTKRHYVAAALGAALSSFVWVGVIGGL